MLSPAVRPYLYTESSCDLVAIGQIAQCQSIKNDLPAQVECFFFFFSFFLFEYSLLAFGLLASHRQDVKDII